MGLRIHLILRKIEKDKLYTLPLVYKNSLPDRQEAESLGFRYLKDTMFTGGGFNYDIIILAKGDHHIIFDYDRAERSLYVYSFDFTLEFFRETQEALESWSMDLKGADPGDEYFVWYAYSLFQYFYDQCGGRFSILDDHKDYVTNPDYL